MLGAGRGGRETSRYERAGKELSGDKKKLSSWQKHLLTRDFFRSPPPPTLLGRHARILKRILKTFKIYRSIVFVILVLNNTLFVILSLDNTLYYNYFHPVFKKPSK